MKYCFLIVLLMASGAAYGAAAEWTDAQIRSEIKSVTRINVYTYQAVCRTKGFVTVSRGQAGACVTCIRHGGSMDVEVLPGNWFDICQKRYNKASKKSKE